MAQIAVSGVSTVRKEQQMAHDAMQARHIAVNRRREEVEAAPRTRPMAAGDEATMERAAAPMKVMARTKVRAQPEAPPAQPEAPARPAHAPMFDEQGRGLDVTGEVIPMETDQWQGRQDWAVHGRREETKAGLRDVQSLRDQARIDRGRADLAERQSEILGGMKDQALKEAGHASEKAGLIRGKGEDLTKLKVFTEKRADEAARTAGVEADIALDTSVLEAADQERIAQVAAINVESLVQERAEALKDIGKIKDQTAAAVDERRAQIEMIANAAAEAMQDTRLAAARADAEAAVMSAARGAGGQVVEQQAAGRQAQTQRQLGRIGTKERLQKGQVESQIKGIEARGNVAKRRARLAHFKTFRAEEREGLRTKGARERKAHIEKLGQTRHDEIEKAGLLEEEGLDIRAAMIGRDADAAEIEAKGIEVASGKLSLQAASYEMQAAGALLDADAMRTNARMAERTADEGLQSLADRPGIGDWNAYGRQVDRANKINRIGSVISTIGSIGRAFF